MTVMTSSQSGGGFCIYRLAVLEFFVIQGESKKTDTFDIQMNNKGVSFFLLTL
jgi:hypothetical protein